MTDDGLQISNFKGGFPGSRLKNRTAAEKSSVFLCAFAPLRETNLSPAVEAKAQRRSKAFLKRLVVIEDQ
jgi:hypothetical protein